MPGPLQGLDAKQEGQVAPLGGGRSLGGRLGLHQSVCHALGGRSRERRRRGRLGRGLWHSATRQQGNSRTRKRAISNGSFHPFLLLQDRLNGRSIEQGWDAGDWPRETDGRERETGGPRIRNGRSASRSGRSACAKRMIGNSKRTVRPGKRMARNFYPTVHSAERVPGKIVANRPRLETGGSKTGANDRLPVFGAERSAPIVRVSERLAPRRVPSSALRRHRRMREAYHPAKVLRSAPAFPEEAR